MMFDYSLAGIVSLGLLIYLIARGSSMAQRQAQQAQQEQSAFDDYVRQTAGGSPTDQLAKLSDLKDKGVITQAEFDSQKAKLLG